MKRVISFIGALCVILGNLTLAAVLPGVPAFAADTDGGDTTPPGSVTITVVMPEPTPAPEPEEPVAAFIKVYPSDVTETAENGNRLIIKTYELNADEKPEDIPRESFERSGYSYALTDITRKETANAETRAHSETVTVSTDTKELEQILPLLAPTIEYKTEDGFVGILSLDIASIKVETAGTKTTSYEMKVTREYPHLSGSDTSFIPKTVTDNGKTYSLAGVDWRAGNYETVDYEQIPEYYTAVATYTATGTSTKVTGYTTTAEYGGTLAKLTQGRTVYTAYFLGEEIRTPLEQLTIEETDEAVAPETSPDPAAASESAASAAEPTAAPSGDGETNHGNNALLVILPILGAAAGVLYYFFKKRKGQSHNEKNNNPAAVVHNADGGDDPPRNGG